MKLTKANLLKIVVPEGKAELLVFDETLPGFGLRVHAGGRRTWIAQYRIGTRQRRFVLGTVDTLDADDARRRARDALAMAQLGKDPQAEKEAAKAQASVTLGSVAEQYLMRHAANRLKPRSLIEVQRHLRKAWAPLAGTPLHKIERAAVAARLGQIAVEQGAPTANRARTTLSTLFSWAIGEGIADHNPVIGTNKAAEEVSRDRVLTDDELSLIWRTLGSNDYGTIVRLLILTAARREEIGGALWSELTGDVLRIGAERSKNRLAHEIPLSGLAIAILSALPPFHDRERIFGSGKKGPYSNWSLAKADLDARMLAALKAERGSKAVLVPWRIHDLRRTAATRMGDLGVQPHVVEAVLNHISGSRAGVAGTYNRAAYREEKRAALALWADRVASLLES